MRGGSAGRHSRRSTRSRCSREKTRGNLEEEERKLFESLLYELRMRFVEIDAGELRTLSAGTLIELQHPGQAEPRVCDIDRDAAPTATTCSRACSRRSTCGTTLELEVLPDAAGRRSTLEVEPRCPRAALPAALAAVHGRTATTSCIAPQRHGAPRRIRAGRALASCDLTQGGSRPGPGWAAARATRPRCCSGLARFRQELIRPPPRELHALALSVSGADVPYLPGPGTGTGRDRNRGSRSSPWRAMPGLAPGGRQSRDFPRYGGGLPGCRLRSRASLTGSGAGSTMRAFSDVCVARRRIGLGRPWGPIGGPIGGPADQRSRTRGHRRLCPPVGASGRCGCVRVGRDRGQHDRKRCDRVRSLCLDGRRAKVGAACSGDQHKEAGRRCAGTGSTSAVHDRLDRLVGRPP